MLSAEVILESTEFDPPEFTVGEEVCITVILSHDQPMNILVPSVFPVSAEWVIEQVVINQPSNYKTRIDVFFRSFVPGSGELPPVDLGEWTLPGFVIFTNPVLGESDIELKSLRAQVLLPGTRLYLAVILVSLMVAPFVMIFLGRFLKKQSLFLYRKFKIRRPFFRLNRLLRKLEASEETLEAKDFYIHLTDGIKKYLTEKLHRDFNSATTLEIAEAEYLVRHQVNLKDLVKLLKKSDLVKFAGKGESLRDRHKSLETVRSFCRHLEEKEEVNDLF
jgi:hypothetical protein